MKTAHPDQCVELLGEPSWAFDDGFPVYHIQHANCISHTIKLDPFPCYHHDMQQVTLEFERCRRVAPLPLPLKLFVFSHEGVSRTNGVFYDATQWEDVGEDENGKTIWRQDPIGMIALHGKRIPLHHAMTTYLVNHEYGHAVCHHLARLRGFKDIFAFEQWYTDNVRPESGKGYGARKWHSNVGELMANDFRIIVMAREIEFWPHEGHNRPAQCPAAITFWREAENQLQHDEAQ